MRTHTVATVLVLIAVGAAAPAAAQVSDSDGWHFDLAPLYLWASSLDGTLTARDQNIPFEVPFNQAFANLEMAFTVHFEAWNGRWGLLTDLNFMDLSGDTSFGPLKYEVSLENLIAELAGGFRFDNASFIYVGARYYGVESTITGALVPELGVDKGWTDPIVGFGWRPRLSERWTFSGAVDVGGFGISSNLTWKAEAVIDWQVGKFIALGAGYRLLDYEYEDDDEGFAYKLRQNGPVIFLRFFW